ncbi:MAG TPA: ROK family protein [Niabella sp.]|nr:ROK family protein [Niabella sp.]
MTNAGIRLGADIGGSHIATALVDVVNRGIVPLSASRVSVDSKASAGEIIHCWSSALKTTMQLSDQSIDSVGIAMPGPFDYDAGICLMKGNDKYEALYGLNIKEILSGNLDIPAQCIHISNDAACFLRGEVMAGIPSNYSTAIGITLGTGLGTSYYKNGEAADAGLWCMPFRSGIAEDYISTRWFLKKYYELAGKRLPDVKALSLLHHSCRYARQVFDEFAGNLSAFLGLFVQKNNPDIIVIGGNIAKAASFFLQATEAKLSEMGINIPLHTATLGEDALIFGAAL